MAFLTAFRRGTFFDSLVDDDDFERFGEYRWNATNQWYLLRTAPLPNGKTGNFYLHREIMGLKPGQRNAAGERLLVDHIDENVLDNRRSNLQILTYAEHAAKKRKKKKDLPRNIIRRGDTFSYAWQKDRKNYTGDGFGTPDQAYQALLIRKAEVSGG